MTSVSRTPPRAVSKPARALGHAACAICLFLLSGVVHAHAAGPGRGLFGYSEHVKEGFSIFPMWARVLKRHADEMEADRHCRQSPRPSCQLGEWQGFLASLRARDPRDQIAAVNAHGNERRYVTDQDNYGMDDHWATPREFLANGGDCEDYAIFKYFSLRQLGFPAEALRIVVVQDTNLRIPHAVLAVYFGNDILILDNQVQQVMSHRQIAHYVPVYSINEKQWWMHLP